MMMFYFFLQILLRRIGSHFNQRSRAFAHVPFQSRQEYAHPGPSLVGPSNPRPRANAHTDSPFPARLFWPAPPQKDSRRVPRRLRRSLLVCHGEWQWRFLLSLFLLLLYVVVQVSSFALFFCLLLIISHFIVIIIVIISTFVCLIYCSNNFYSYWAWLVCFLVAGCTGYDAKFIWLKSWALCHHGSVSAIHNSNLGCHLLFKLINFSICVRGPH